jgi:hypothetical protein
MRWIDKELGNFWWADSVTQISTKKKYELFIDIVSDWNNLTPTLSKILGNKFYTLYTGHIIHDGNRSCGNLYSYINDYEKGGKLIEQGGWNTAQKMLEFVREAEILIDLYNNLNK